MGLIVYNWISGSLSNFAKKKQGQLCLKTRALIKQEIILDKKTGCLCVKISLTAAPI